jgi:hypothetical protein
MRFPPSVVEAQHAWALDRYGQFATSRLDESRLLAIREVSDVLRCPRLVGSLLILVLKMRFPPSVVESKHGWRTAMRLEDRNEVENRNGACVMEVASLGSRAKMRTKEGGKERKGRRLGWNDRGMKPNPY